MSLLSFSPTNSQQSNVVNPDSSTWSGSFSSNETNHGTGLPNMFRKGMDAVSASKMNGGNRMKNLSHPYSKKLRRKIKNIIQKYKMSHHKKHSIKRTLKRMYKHKGGKKLYKKSRRTRHKTRRHRKSLKGGRYYSLPTYSTGGVLAANELGLANPVPYSMNQ